jgi:CrcB protein
MLVPIAAACLNGRDGMVVKLSLLALAGAVGTLARYALAGLVQRIAGESFPWGTFVVNASGCFLFGLVWRLAEERLVISGETRFILLTGFMGAYTTFSTYAFETSAMLRDSAWLLAAGNAMLHNGIGLACILAGLATAKLF